MRHILLLWGLIWGLLCGLAPMAAASSTSLSPTPQVRLSLAPASGVELGTDLLLRVEVLVPTWFLDAPRFPDTFELPGATVELQKGSAENLSDAIAGSTWAGLRRYYRIQPLNPGVFRLPELAIPLTYAQGGGKGPLTATARGRLATPLRVAVPAAAARLDPFIAARHLRLSQRLERPGGDLGVGDAVRRTVVVETDATALEFPATFWPQPAGARVYVDPPRRVERRADAAARLMLRLEQSATWLFEGPGTYELPALTLEWWDLEARQVRRTQLPTVPLTVGPARAASAFALPGALTEQAPMLGGGGLSPVAWGLAVAAAVMVAITVVLWGLWRGRPLGRRMLDWGQGQWQALRASEGAAFRRLLRACRRHDGPAAWAALRVWLDVRAGPGAGLASWLLNQVPSTELAQALAELDAALYAGPGSSTALPWRGTALCRQLILARRQLPPQRQAKPASLPAALNP